MTIEIFIITLASLAVLLVVGIIVSVFIEHSQLSNTEQTEQSAEMQAQEKSNSIIHSAMKQARSMLVHAELTGIKEVVRSRHDTDQLEQAYEEHLRTLIARSEKHLEQTTLSIENHYIQLFKKAEQQISQQIADNQQRIMNELDLAIEESHKLLTTQTEATHEEIKRRLDSEIAGAKQAVDTYKNKRIEGIDNHIAELVIETVKRTIDKALTPQEHTDLVIRSLQEAKEDGFFT